MPNTTRRQFLRSSVQTAAVAASLPTLLSESALAAARPVIRTGDDGAQPGLGRWHNWAGNQVSNPTAFVTPANLAELRAAVRAGTQIRVVGSGHSFSGLVPTDHTLIRLFKLNRILSVDHDRQLVKAEAGIKLYEFNRQLWSLGYCLPSLGDIDRQAIGGLASTATHGTGLAWGSTSGKASIHGMELVLANGDLLSLSEDRPGDRPWLEAARVSLGTLGVIYSITYKVDRAHNLEQVTRVMTLAEAMDPRHIRDNDHYEFFYFPYTDKAQGVVRNKTSKPSTIRAGETFFNEIFMENLLLGLLMGVTHRRGLPGMMRFLASQVTEGTVVGPSYDIMTTTRRVKFVESENAVALGHYRVGVQHYLNTVEDFARRDEFYASFPFEVRFLGADQGTMLSPAQGSQKCYLSINLHNKFKGYTPFLQQFEQRIAPLGPRPHWGKLFYRNPLGQYPRAREFLALRQQLDPTGKFLNDFLIALFSGRSL
jgi:L-gulonolactone oxidase